MKSPDPLLPTNTNGRSPTTLTETANYRPSIDAPKLFALYFVSREFMAAAKRVEPAKHVELLFVPPNCSAFNVGMAFELMFKVFLVLDNGSTKKTHVFRKLHKALDQDSKNSIERCVKKCGWQSISQFIDYLDQDVRPGDRRYFEVHGLMDGFWWTDHREALSGLGLVYDRISELAAARIWVDPSLPLQSREE